MLDSQYLHAPVVTGGDVTVGDVTARLFIVAFMQVAVDPVVAIILEH